MAAGVTILASTLAGCGASDGVSSSGAHTHPVSTHAVTDPPLPPAPATVTVMPHAPTKAVPRSFFGISTEYWAIPLFERNRSRFVRILRLLHAPGTGPFVLRIGGDSTDHSVFDLNVGRHPTGIFALDTGWFRQMSALVHDVGARLILDLNLVANLPRMAALWADAAVDELPRGSVEGFEIGNEPDLYSHHFWLAVFARDAPLVRVLPLKLSPARYVDLFRSYGRTVELLAPRMALFGPVLAYPIAHVKWIAALLEGPHPRLRMVTAHEYPYSACVSPRSRSYPTVARLLSEQATAGVAAKLRPSIGFAHRAGLPFRLTELNSVTCAGRPGVSDTFAAALWAPDMLFELLRAGVDGVNVHVRAYTVNAAFGVTPRGVVARPLLYGLILFTRMLGADARLVGLHAQTAQRAHLKAWAVRVSGDRLHVLLINKGPSAISAKLVLPATGPATIQRLLAPSVTSRSGVTLDGQQLGHDDRWRGHRSDESAAGVSGVYRLVLPPTSAALLTVRTVGTSR